MRRSVKSSQRQVRVMAVTLTGTGTAAIAGMDAAQMTLTDNGTGNYTLTFREPFGSADFVVSATTLTDNTITRVSTKTISSVIIVSENLSGTATDAVMDIVIVGSDISARY
jgi:hypothetical protein